MDQQQDYRKTLTDIRNLMDQSAKFHSISGLAGISAGIAALAGIAVFYLYFGFSLFDPFLFVNYRTVPFLMADGTLVLLVSLGLALYFTRRSANARQERLWTPLFRRILVYWSIPMVTGGILMLPYFSGSGPVLFPSAIALTLTFYGFALISASRFTYNELFWLGVTEIILGLLGYYFWRYSLICWAFGFGVMNIVFGIVMYRKYEQKNSRTIEQ